MLITANIFQPLISVFAAVIKFYHENLGASWGWSIVLLTVSVRLIMVPLAIKQVGSMRKMQHLQPQMKALQKKYKDDKQRQQEEMMKFYRENDVNPFASCLPLVAQFPVFISLYYMLRKNLRTDICRQTQLNFQAKYAKSYMLSHHVSAKAAHQVALSQTTACGPHYQGAGFLFVHDITSTATGVTLVLLIILYIGTQMASTLLMSAPTMDRNQRNMMLFIPLVFVLFIIRFPAGLIIYWITTNSWTMVQQYSIKRMMGPMPASAVVEDVDADDDDGGGGGLASLFRGRGSRGGDDSPSASGNARQTSRASAMPPPPPRKKKKRSGRRR
jgi:YidC/Oxa1 family membrane protein insertase